MSKFQYFDTYGESLEWHQNSHLWVVCQMNFSWRQGSQIPLEQYRSLSYLAWILVKEVTIRNGILMIIPKTRPLLLLNSHWQYVWIISWVVLKALVRVSSVSKRSPTYPFHFWSLTFKKVYFFWLSTRLALRKMTVSFILPFSLPIIPPKRMVSSSLKV